MLTAKGQRLQSKLSQGVSNDTLLELMRPIVQKYSKRIVERIRKEGIEGGASSYSVGWARVRGKNSKQTSFKDYTFEGDMLNSVGIQDEESASNYVKFVVSPSSGKQYDKAEGHSNYENKNIIEMTQDEADDFKEEAMETIKNYLANVFR